MTAEEILAAAADQVEKGWCQHLFIDEWSRVCLAGAIAQVALGNALRGRELYPQDSYGLPSDHPARVALEAVAQELEITPRDRVAYWNNAPDRTVEEVATVLRNSKRHL